MGRPLGRSRANIPEHGHCIDAARGGRGARIGVPLGEGAVHPNPDQPVAAARQTCELAGFGAAGDIDPDLVEWNYGITKASAPWIFTRTDPAGMCGAMVVLTVETPANISDRADRLLARLREHLAMLRFSRTANLAQFSRRDGSDWQSSKLNTWPSVRHRSASSHMKPVTEGRGHCAMECPCRSITEPASRKPLRLWICGLAARCGRRCPRCRS